MKGRGTRTCDFSQTWITESELPDHIESHKKQFLLFDFFGNYHYFEKDFDYDEVLKLPSQPSELSDDPSVLRNIDEAVNLAPDPLAELREILIPDQGMKIDRDLYPAFQKQITGDPILKNMVLKQHFDQAESYLHEHVLDKPEEFFTIEKIRKSLGLDRMLTVPELLLYAFEHIGHIPSQKECLDEEFDKLDNALKPSDSIYNAAREFFDAYVSDTEYRDIIESKRFADLSTHPSGNAFKNLSDDLRQSIPFYIKQNVNLERLANVR